MTLLGWRYHGRERPLVPQKDHTVPRAAVQRMLPNPEGRRRASHRLWECWKPGAGAGTFSSGRFQKKNGDTETKAGESPLLQCHHLREVLLGMWMPEGAGEKRRDGLTGGFQEAASHQ